VYGSGYTYPSTWSSGYYSTPSYYGGMRRGWRR